MNNMLKKNKKNVNDDKNAKNVKKGQNIIITMGTIGTTLS